MGAWKSVIVFKKINFQERPVSLFQDNVEQALKKVQQQIDDGVVVDEDTLEGNGTLDSPLNVIGVDGGGA